jgi:hypothetical protein
MRLDAHQHFWRYDPAQFPWINESMAALKRDFLPDDLAPLMRSAGFDGHGACHRDELRVPMPTESREAILGRTCARFYSLSTSKKDLRN